MLCRLSACFLVASLVLGNAEAKNVIDTIADTGAFNTFVAAVKEAGLEETLNGPGPFTIYAPTDDAFTKIPRQELELLLLPENRDMLRAVLSNHVLAGQVTARDVLGKRLEAITITGNHLDLGAATIDPPVQMPVIARFVHPKESPRRPRLSSPIAHRSNTANHTNHH